MTKVFKLDFTSFIKLIMTLQEVVFKILKGWWLIIGFGLVASLIFFPKLNQNTYISSIGIGINYSTPEFLKYTENNDNYILINQEMSKFLATRFASVEMQAFVAQDMDFEPKSYDSVLPFYTINRQANGFVSLTLETNNEEEGRKFLEAVKKNYNKIIDTEINKLQPKEFKIEAQKEFLEAVKPVSRPLQFQLLPTITGIIIGIFTSLILPNKTKS